MSEHNLYKQLNEALMEASGKVLYQAALAGHLLAWGPTVPTLASTGYAKGCLFIHTDASGRADAWYQNVGTGASCDFEAQAPTELADAGSLITATTIEGALQEAFQHIQSAQAFVPIPLGSFTLEDGTALTKYAAGGATPGFQQLANKEIVLAWDGNATQTAVGCTIPMPPDLDDSADVVVHYLANMAGATDTPVIVNEAYFNKGDTDCAGTDDEVDGGVTLTEYSMTIAATHVPAAPAALTLVFDPTNGEMTTDELYIYGVWLEYTRKTLTS